MWFSLDNHLTVNKVVTIYMVVGITEKDMYHIHDMPHDMPANY